MIKPKKILLLVLLCIAAVIVLLAILIAVNASRNKKVMNETLRKGMEELGSRYTVTPLDPRAYQDLKFYGVMRFHTDQYRIEELGNLSVMTADMGFMQMISYVITPYEKAVPLCTLDFMYIMGNRKSYVEFYDLVSDVQSEEYRQVLDTLSGMIRRYDAVSDAEVSEAWYDSLLSVRMHKALKRADDTQNEEMFCDALRTYLDTAKTLSAHSKEDAAAQLANTKAYSDNLIDKGGVSTDVFKKALGEDTTRDFFDTVFFGSGLYRDPVVEVL